MTGLLLLALLAGCGSSPPINYYVLSAQDGAAQGGNTPSLGVGPVVIPEYLNRANLVTERERNTLTIARFDHWAEPLEDGIKRVLAINLAGLMNTQNVYTFPWRPEQAPEYGVRINLLQLDASEREATLAAEWQVYRPGATGALARRLSRLHHPLPGGSPRPEQIAGAYSALLFQLSEAIAGAIESSGATGAE
jgi:uncharacterized lipoprotein YmbA